jgi:hypothetical protein
VAIPIYRETPLWILARPVGDNTKGAVAVSLCRRTPRIHFVA